MRAIGVGRIERGVLEAAWGEGPGSLIYTAIEIKCKAHFVQNDFTSAAYGQSEVLQATDTSLQSRATFAFMPPAPEQRFTPTLLCNTPGHEREKNSTSAQQKDSHYRVLPYLINRYRVFSCHTVHAVQCKTRGHAMATPVQCVITLTIWAGGVLQPSDLLGSGACCAVLCRAVLSAFTVRFYCAGFERQHDTNQKDRNNASCPSLLPYSIPRICQRAVPGRSIESVRVEGGSPSTAPCAAGVDPHLERNPPKERHPSVGTCRSTFIHGNGWGERVRDNGRQRRLGMRGQMVSHPFRQ